MNNILFKYVIIPIYNKLKGFKRVEYYNLLKKRDSFSIEELNLIQIKRLKKLLKHCYQNVPYYKNLFDKLNIHPEDIKNLSDYSRYIPELTKQDITQNFNDLTDKNIPLDKLCYDSTSGSTGIPFKMLRSKNDQEYGFALRYRSNAWCGWKYYNKSVWFVSDTRHITELYRLKGRISLWIKRRLLINTKKITTENMFKWVKQIEKFKPEHVYGYSSLLAEFSQFIIENNIKITGIKGVYSTAEVLRNREIISKAFNAPVYDQYGASEVPCIAHECKHGNMHINTDEVLIEFVDINKESEIKKIICTPLYLYGMPFLRYELGDTAVPSNKKCYCGLSYPVMELKVGRTSDNIVSPTGKMVSGITLGWYITEATTGIKQFQLIQENLSTFTFRLVTDDKNFDNDKNIINIMDLFYEMLETKDIKIKFDYTDKIFPEKNGKYRPIVSKCLSNNQETNKLSC